MKKWVFLLGLAASTAMAQSLNIAVADMNKVIQTSPQMVAIQSDLDKKFSPRHKKIMAKMELAKADNEKLLKEGNVMKSSDRQALTNTINQARESIMAEQAKFQEDYENARQAALKSLLEKVNKVTTDLAQASHYDMILNRVAAPFAANSLDVTDDLIKKLKEIG